MGSKENLTVLCFYILLVDSQGPPMPSQWILFFGILRELAIMIP